MHKFKLKKDGKVVGYVELWHYGGLLYSKDGDFSLLSNKPKLPREIEGEGLTFHPFVCCDKNRDEVYAGDKTNNGIVEYNKEKLRWVAGNVPIRHYKNIKLIKK